MLWVFTFFGSRCGICLSLGPLGNPRVPYMSKTSLKISLENTWEFQDCQLCSFTSLVLGRAPVFQSPAKQYFIQQNLWFLAQGLERVFGQHIACS